MSGIKSSVIKSVRVTKRLKANGIVGREDEMNKRIGENIEQTEKMISEGRENIKNIFVSSSDLPSASDLEFHTIGDELPPPVCPLI